MLPKKLSLRYFLEFSYLGSPFHGWQRQTNAISVQQSIEECLSKIMREEISIVGAGRTDTGVHARKMYAHFDWPEEIDTDELQFKLDRFLKDDIHCKKIILVADDLHARFSAKSRTYKYFISLGKDPFLQDSAWLYPGKLDVDKMQKASKIVFDYTDFECFSKSNTDVKTFNCQIMESNWEQNEHVLCYTVRADRFLRNMVRALVGTMVGIGNGKIELDDLKRIIESKNRSEAGESAPAQGLFLYDINYS